MSSLIVAANRGPVSLDTNEAGALVGGHGSGGLAPSLADALRGTEALFVAASMNETEQRAAREGWPEEIATPCPVLLVDVDEELRNGAYKIVSNETLWYLYHGLFDQARHPLLDAAFGRALDAYRAYNAAFAEVIAGHADEGAVVFVNDYHLAFVGEQLRRDRPDLRTVHFSHTPFCSIEELAIFPEPLQRELVGAMAAFGACGFHTSRWADRFADCCAALEIAPPELFVQPLGIDATQLRRELERPQVAAASARLAEACGGRRLIVRSDRVELSKNLLRGFSAFAELLETHPELQGEVVFVARAYSSRHDLVDYAAYEREVERLAAEVNERFGAPGYTPVLLEVADDFDATLAAYLAYDVLLVNPVRDGLNLVAKEGPALNVRDGVLVLSTEAGAFVELHEAAVAVQPFDVSATALALATALEMAPAERRARAERLRTIVESTTSKSWLGAVLDHARAPKPKH